MPRPRPAPRPPRSPLAAVGLAGCAKDEDPPTLPDGATLVSESATAMRPVKSAHVTHRRGGRRSRTLPIKRAEGDLHAAPATPRAPIQLEQFGVLIEFEFVVLGDKTSTSRARPAAGSRCRGRDGRPIYDPSAILDPTGASRSCWPPPRTPKTEGQETVDGKDTYRVAVQASTAPRSARSCPGVPDGVTGKLWLDTPDKHLRQGRPHRARAAGAAPARSRSTLDQHRRRR